MPNGWMRDQAKRHKVPVEKVEAAWNDCKEGIKPGEGGKGWGLVVECTKSKLRKMKKK